MDFLEMALVAMMQGGAAAFALPYSVDFSTLADGPLPSWFQGATWAVSGGNGVNTPALGDELLTDPGLEATYTAGLCDTLAKNGAPTVAQSADVHGGTKSQSFDATGTNQWLRYPEVAAISGAWYLASLWHKTIAGGNDNDFHTLISQGASVPVGIASPGWKFTGAAWTQKKTSFGAGSTANIGFYAAWNSAAGAQTVLIDDGSLMRLTYADLFAMLPAAPRTATVKIKPSVAIDNTISGVVIWGNAQTSPSTFIMATINKRYSEATIELGLMKCVAGTYTQLINPTSTGEVLNAWLEIRPVDDDTVALYYNDVQIGANQDVVDVPGAFPGMFITGGNNVKSFFVG